MRDTEGNIYLGSNLHNVILERYRRYCDNLTVLLRRSEKIYSPSEAQTTAFRLDENLARAVDMPDLYRPRKNMLSLKVRKEITDRIAEEIRKADKVIVRLSGNFYTDTAIRLCREYGRTYLVEAVQFEYEFKYYYSRLTRILAPYAEAKAKKIISQAPYVVYVTKSEMQKRYPSSGRTLGCSDVCIPSLDPLAPQKYLALALLKSEGITNVEYHLAGGGSPGKLTKLAAALNVRDQVRFYGAVPHEEMPDWYDHLDVYIHPSFTETLGRSVIEAMSRALPAACAGVGGMLEYADRDIMFRPGNVREIADVMKRLLEPETRKRESVISFDIAHDFTKEKLDPVRDKFYLEFANA